VVPPEVVVEVPSPLAVLLELVVVLLDLAFFAQPESLL
jgi:hypothetical protein